MVTQECMTLEVIDRGIVLRRAFNASPELIFEATTRPEHVRNWWGPRGTGLTVCEADVRPGGAWRYVMLGPDGVDYDNLITYMEVVRPERQAYDINEPGDPSQFTATVTFVDNADGTVLTMRSVFPTAAARDFVVREYKAIEGGNQTLDRLGEYLATT
jgi:uncharacterized protein YndB with AHSA1/START domain